MQKFEWDNETGGVILQKNTANVVTEIRPVYSYEMDKLGFAEYWDYPHTEKAPIMWCDERNYIYRGKLMLSIDRAESIQDSPKFSYINTDTLGNSLKCIDIDEMVKKNLEIMDNMVKSSLEIIYHAYMKYKDKIEFCFVAYSGGKDSMVVLDLVKRILPAGTFMINWSDTGMENSESYKIIENEKKLCEEAGIPFLVSRSDISTLDYWKKIGPPSKKNRWCCSVVKSIPSEKKLRKMCGKADYKALMFQGIRASESSKRKKEGFINEESKALQNYTCNPILDWSSLEVFLYIYARKLKMHRGYILGLKRLGCLICPMAPIDGLKKDINTFPDEAAQWIEAIEDIYRPKFSDEQSLEKFMNQAKWADRNGSSGTTLVVNHREYMLNGKLHIEMWNPTTDYKVWLKTIGIPKGKNTIIFRGKEYHYSIEEIPEQIHVSVSDPNALKDDSFLELFKNVFRKSAYCVGCQICEMDCLNGCISMDDGKVMISDDCKHCAGCHRTHNGCIVFKSKTNINEVLL